jgi:pimeloyl-ACP methyl ester carboxylesterase
MTPTNDLIVVLPGITGSTLARHGRPVWAVSAGALVDGIRRLGRNLEMLALPEGIGDNYPDDGVEPISLMPSLHAIPGVWAPIRGYTELLDHLRSRGYREGAAGEPGNLLPVAYDWRLSNRYNGARLRTLVEHALALWRSQGGRYADAEVVFICHSMGGLVARWYIEKEGGAEVTRKLITLGTPYRGAAKSLIQLVNGVPRKIGRLSPDLTRLARSFPSMYQLIPEYACINSGADLIYATDADLPDLPKDMIADGLRFHRQLRDAEIAHAGNLQTHAIVGTRQPTHTTVTMTSQGVAQPVDTYRGQQLHGDGTVPLTGATRADVPMDSPLLRRVADIHGNLQSNRAALDEIDGALTGQDVIVKAAGVDATLNAPELLTTAEPLEITIDTDDNHRLLIQLFDEADHEVDRATPRPRRGHSRCTFQDISPGGYVIKVSGVSGPAVNPITAPLTTWDATVDGEQ